MRSMDGSNHVKPFPLCISGNRFHSGNQLSAIPFSSFANGTSRTNVQIRLIK